ncbi:MAG TPA: hypothetical protein DCE80_04580 [Ignavibacteriales bacterium]|nr:hypothetical protein [Ignavibacteriales bacterium]
MSALRSAILIIGWPVLIFGSIYLVVKGRAVYKMVKGSLVGGVTRALVISMLVGMYSLGIVATALMFCDERGVYLVLPIFLVWFVTFVWSLKVLVKAQEKAKSLSTK